MKHSTSPVVAAAAAVAALAAPSAALAHPSVYVTSTPVLSTAMPAPLCSATGNTGPYTAAAYLATCVTQTRYVFTNHGNTYLLRESNGKTTGGAISYAHRPGGATGLAAASDFNIFASAPQGPTTGAQPHATCDVPALTTPTVIRSWQGTDPFFAYVPFQATAVGFDDSAASWLGVVQAATGVDLASLADTDAAREAACEALPGATAASYVPADATQSTLASWSSGQVHVAVEPLEEEIAELTDARDALNEERSALIEQLASEHALATSLQSQYDGAMAHIRTLQLALRALRITLPSALPSVDAIARSGIAPTIAGPAGKTVVARLLIAASKARKLGLKSRVLASKSVVLDATGNAAFELKPSAAVAAKLAEASGPLAIGVDARGADRHAIAGGTLAG